MNKLSFTLGCLAKETHFPNSECGQRQFATAYKKES